MKNWLKNLLFVLFSFIFLGVGIFVAQFFIYKNGNPLKDPNFFARSPLDSTTMLSNSLPVDSTQSWTNDTLEVKEPIIKKETQKETFDEKIKSSGNYLVITGRFGKRLNANREVEKLKAMGYKNAYIFSESLIDVVSAGQFGKNEAKKIALELKNKGYDTIVKHK